jgi:hypothetical protein
MFVPLVGSDTPGPTRGTNILDLIATNQPSSFGRTEIIPGVSEPTRGTNILDLIVTNQPSSFRRTEIIPRSKMFVPLVGSDTPGIISVLRKLDG